VLHQGTEPKILAHFLALTTKASSPVFVFFLSQSLGVRVCVLKRNNKHKQKSQTKNTNQKHKQKTQTKDTNQKHNQKTQTKHINISPFEDHPRDILGRHCLESNKLDSKQCLPRIIN